MQRGRGPRPPGGSGLRPKKDGIHAGLEELIPTGFAFPKPPTDKRPDSGSRGVKSRPGTAGRGPGASNGLPNDLLGSISKLEKESEQRAMELIKLRTLILKLEAQREDALDTVKQCKKENSDTKDELARCQSELAILRKEQVANRISGWLDTATGLSTVRAASYLPESPMHNDRTMSQGMMVPGQLPLSSRGVGGRSMGGIRSRVSGPGYTSIDVPRRSPHSSVLTSPPLPSPSPLSSQSPLVVDATEGRMDSIVSTDGAVPSSNIMEASNSAQILQLQSELEQALIVQQQALADKAEAEQKVAEALIEKEALEKEKKERQDKEKKVVDSNRLLKEKEEALRRLQEIVSKLEEDKDHEVQMRQVEIQHLKDLHEVEMKRMREENEAFKEQFEAYKNQPPSPQSQQQEGDASNEQLVIMEAEWKEKLAAAEAEAQVKIEELDRKMKEAEEALSIARSDSERYQKEVQILKEAAEAMAREVEEKEAQHKIEVERSSAVAREVALAGPTPQMRDLEKSLAITKEELSALHKQREEFEGKLSKMETLEESVKSLQASFEASSREASALKTEREAWLAKEKEMKDQLATLKPMILQAVAEAEAKGRREADAAMKKAKSEWDKEKKAEIDEGTKSSSTEIARLKSEHEETIVKLKSAVSESEAHQKAAEEALSHSKKLAEEVEVMKRRLEASDMEKRETEVLASKLKTEVSELVEAAKLKEEALSKSSADAKAAKNASDELEEARKVLESQWKALEEKEAMLIGLQASGTALSAKLASATKEMEDKVKESQDLLRIAAEEKEQYRLEAEAAKASARDAEEKAASNSSGIADTEKRLGDLLSSQREEMEQRVADLTAEIDSLKASAASIESRSSETESELKASEEKCKVLQAEHSSAMDQKVAAELRAADAESQAKQLKQQLEALVVETSTSSSSSPPPPDSSAEKDDVDEMRDQGERMRTLIKTMALQMETLQNNLLTQTSLVAKVQAALEEEKAESETLATHLQSTRLKESELKARLEEAERKLTSMRLKSIEVGAPLVATRPSSAGLDPQQSILSRGSNQSQRGIIKPQASKGRSSPSGLDAMTKSVELPSIVSKGV